jgi:hypothetical protein
MPKRQSDEWQGRPRLEQRAAEQESAEQERASSAPSLGSDPTPAGSGGVELGELGAP